MPDTFKVEFNPNPIQKTFIENRPLKPDGSPGADLFSSRMGEGKSAALCWAAFHHTRHNPGAHWAIIRDTWENLRGTTLEEFFRWFPSGIMGTWHQTNKEFTWAEGVAKGKVMFLGMDDPQDASKLMSRAIAGFGMDEPAPAIGTSGIDELIFDIAHSRLRQPGMNWYAAKVAENNPDESHWSFRKFVSPGIKGFHVHQPTNPENIQNLPSSYYSGLRAVWAHRPDLVRRFVDGEFGYQSEGKGVTSKQWSDKIHLALGLIPLPRQELVLLWDFGHNPTCIITQKTPLGHWLILDAIVGDETGAEELIVDAVKPLLIQKYPKFTIKHIGDPAGKQREQTSILRSAVKMVKKSLGGTWRSGPVRTDERIEPLRSALSRTIGGRGLIQVDRENAAAVWHALRGGWHYHVSRTGLVSGEPKKNIHSHPGDAMGYGAAILFPMGKIGGKTPKMGIPQQATYFQPREEFKIGPETKGLIIPNHGEKLIVTPYE